jgi:hypothetical protein
MAKKEDKAKTRILKENLLKALESSLGVVTTACKNAGCSREIFYRYCKQDAEFAKKVKEIEGIALDFAESQLHKQIQDGNTSATIFYLKTKGKKRGYIERQEIDQPTAKETFRSEKTPISFGDEEETDQKDD